MIAPSLTVGSPPLRLYEFLINLLLHPYERLRMLVPVDPPNGRGVHRGQMAAQKENVEVDGAAAHSRPIELLTENGFSIVRPGEGDGPRRAPEGRLVFIVSHPDGVELEITVGIDQKAVNEVTLRSRGRISSESSYWIVCAERHLADYLAENDRRPPDARLQIERLTLKDLNLATRWGAN